MGTALQWVRSLLFIIQMYLAMAVYGIAYLPLAILKKDGALRACKAYTRWVRWTARWMVGIDTEVRGAVPTDEVVVAAKHQSFLDIILIFGALPRPRFIMKKELVYAPFLGWYALRVGCVPVDRGKRGQAIAQMMEKVKAGQEEPGQLVIYPQGTRVAPGATKPYKIGTALIYDQLGTGCVPAATNVGVFWPRRGIYRHPGLAVVEFLPRIEAGLSNGAFMSRLEDEVETASNRLMADAGLKRIDS
ncbi:1-acyl-sn-glycerol-3-phosphate acyltransferase [Tabrizicola sp. J26]|uniref:lysophospholipid acyltransferase family protein n=1 Tax=Alitabrizicola rongguiensis TaxID=2909234 RepID=UPI001F1A745C|nr:lysophospholipid acyltransferase family protein [Tabrizicola rongguiensis]MCF1708097.1 1-acyl-sn-glycerol-3-phosphate acyltransferase [Tabrizicola rongguiensis]